MSKHKATRPQIEWKWYSRYVLYIIKLGAINALRTNLNKQTRNKTNNKTKN